MRPLNIAVIGCGVIAPSHIEAFQCLEGVTVGALCDLQIDRAVSLGQRYGIEITTTDYQELLRHPDVDAIVICTDHASHAEIAVAALQAGKHVLCEKPLASTAEDLDHMQQAAAEHPELVCAGVLQHRFDSIYQFAQRMLDAGRLGRLLTVDMRVLCYRSVDYYRQDNWRGTWAREGGSLLINQAIHFLDVFSWVSGGVAEVSARCANQTHAGIIETEDSASVTAVMRNGALGSFIATSSSSIAWEPSLVLAGTKGFIEVVSGKLKRLELADQQDQAAAMTEVEALTDSLKVSAAKAYYGPNHSTQVVDFVAAIRDKRPPFINFATAREPVDLVLAIYKSSQTGGWVSLPASGIPS